MSPTKLRILALAAAGAASLFATAASAGGRPCTSAADCGGAYVPASSRYTFSAPRPVYAGAAQTASSYGYGPSYGQAAYAQPAYGPAAYPGEAYGQAAYGYGAGAALPPPPYAVGAPAPQSFGGDPATWGPPVQPGPVGGDPRTWGPPLPAPGGYPNPCAAPSCAPPPPPAPCGERCVPAYAFVPVPAPIHEVHLASDTYTGGVGVTEFVGGGGGGFNGNFEVQGFGSVAAFTSSKAVAWANADAYAKSLAYADASAKANASAQANVNISLKNTFFAKGGYQPHPQGCNTCGGGGEHPGGAKPWGGQSWGYAPTPRGCPTCGGGYGKKH